MELLRDRSRDRQDGYDDRIADEQCKRNVAHENIYVIFRPQEICPGLRAGQPVKRKWRPLGWESKEIARILDGRRNKPSERQHDQYQADGQCEVNVSHLDRTARTAALQNARLRRFRGLDHCRRFRPSHPSAFPARRQRNKPRTDSIAELPGSRSG